MNVPKETLTYHIQNDVLRPFATEIEYNTVTEVDRGERVGTTSLESLRKMSRPGKQLKKACT